MGHIFAVAKFLRDPRVVSHRKSSIHSSLFISHDSMEVPHFLKGPPPCTNSTSGGDGEIYGDLSDVPPQRLKEVPKG